MADTHSPMRADTTARRATRSRLILLIAAITVTGCAGGQPVPTDKQGCCQREEAGPHRAAIVQTATQLIGASTIQMNGRPIAYDCAGVTRAIFLKHGDFTWWHWLDTAVGEMRSGSYYGEYSEIYQKWFGKNPPPQKFYLR